ncbi:MAG TPA: HD domain-containing phosphohydrolase [Thermoanaerobaculia bacterium]|nr:HD domain-containing phosphohydrolase [Thermoanaerobaculia bacterium]
MLDRLPGQIAGAINARTLYPPNHPRVLESIGIVLRELQQTLQEVQSDSITYLLVGDDLIVGDEVIRKTNLSVLAFIDIMKQRRVERLTLAAGLEAAETQQFVDALATGGKLRPMAHIIVGGVRIVMDEESKEEDRKHRELSVDQLEIVREAWARFRVERQLPIDQLEELVWSLIESVARTTRSMLPLAKLKAHDEYTFVHSVNVSLLVLAQARSFGIWGPMLHAFGMAGLLHDIGKLTVPESVLTKPGTLDENEWGVMKSHPREGAWYLSAIEGTPTLAVIVAYEHHLRYDGRSNYPVLRTPRVPNLASRMTAIADTYDAMLTVRPYQQPLGRAAAFEILRKRTGTFYDPVLVANFIRLIESSVS